MHDLPFKEVPTIVTEAANELNALGDAVRQKQFDPRSARLVGDERTDAERESAFNHQREQAAAALLAAEQVLREHLARPR